MDGRLHPLPAIGWTLDFKIAFNIPEDATQWRFVYFGIPASFLVAGSLGVESELKRGREQLTGWRIIHIGLNAFFSGSQMSCDGEILK